MQVKFGLRAMPIADNSSSPHGRDSEMMKCTMFAYSTSPHVSQLYTGFSLLAAKGKISLTQKLSNYSHRGIELMKNLRPQDLNGLFLILDEKKTLFYDTSDSPNLHNDALEISDAYFKRSYTHASIPDRHKSRVYPLGLNYELYTGTLNRHEILRFIARKNVFKNFPREFMKRIAELVSLSFLPTIKNMCAPPVFHQEPRVLFMARAWDPSGEAAELSGEEKAQRGQINETRARCIELLRKELGPKFYGGFAQTKYAVDNYSKLLLESPLTSGKKNYLSLLQQYPICIATTGLHGSIGWKMAEYVAFSKSIISEKLKCLVPGGFEANKNYLEFDTPEECLQAAMNLLADRQSRQRMMEDNWSYYKTYVMPDKLVLRTLSIASET